MPIVNPTFHATKLVADATGTVVKAFKGMSQEKQEEYGEVGRERGREGWKEG